MGIEDGGVRKEEWKVEEWEIKLYNFLLIILNCNKNSKKREPGSGRSKRDSAGESQGHRRWQRRPKSIDQIATVGKEG